MKTNPLFSALNLADINRMQVGLFGQLFLTHPDLLTMFPNGVPKNFELSRMRHSLSADQDRSKVRTPNMGLFSTCHFQTKNVKKCPATSNRADIVN
jgi:hypothetical protein